MATRVQLELDKEGIGEIAKSSEVKSVVHDAGEKIQSGVQSGTKLPVTVNDYETDRAATAVTIAGDEGLKEQAQKGLLTKAAGQIGAEVTEE